MDFRVPDRGKYYDPRPARPVPHRPIASVPPPAPPPEREEALPTTRFRKPKVKKNWKKIVLGLLIVGALGGLAYGYITTRNQLEDQKKAQPAQTETQQLMSEVGALVDLPPGETPTNDTVNNSSKLQSQAFFANAKNGDKVLIFAKSG
jgi:cytoskeletal protein RodZ